MLVKNYEQKMEFSYKRCRFFQRKRVASENEKKDETQAKKELRKNVFPSPWEFSFFSLIQDCFRVRHRELQFLLSPWYRQRENSEFQDRESTQTGYRCRPNSHKISILFGRTARTCPTCRIACLVF